MINDLLEIENLNKLGDGLIADGTSVVDMSADTPDLSEAMGKTLWIQYPSGVREYATVNELNDSTDRLGLTTTVPAGSGLEWGLLLDSEAAGILSSYSVSTITPQAARRYFRETGLWQNNPAGFMGKLEIVRTDPATPQSIVDWLNEFWAVVYDSAAESCGTTVLGYAKPVKDVVDYLVSSGGITQDDADGFYALGGGLRYPSGVTTSDLTAERSAAKANVLSRQRRQAVLTKRAELKNKVQATLDAFDNYYQTADYSVDTDHASAAMTAAENAFTNWTP